MIQVKSTSRFKKQTLLFLFVMLVFIELAVFLSSFRSLRDAFLITPVLGGEKSSVGYSQFTGYPFYFDTILFLWLMICPIFFVSIIKFVSDRWE